MTAYNSQNNAGPAYNRSSKLDSPLANLASVDIVFTSDKSKWTRALVIEMCADNVLAEGGVDRFNPRAGSSVDQNGNAAPPGAEASMNPNDPAYISATGMGWFPGYAINLETGERLNIMFGENSFLSGENGRDMLMNPSSTQYDFFGNPIFGGMHYVYIMDHTDRMVRLDSSIYTFPAYDACHQLRLLFDTLSQHPLWPVRYQSMIFSTTMWTGIPLAVENESWLPEGNDWKLSIRMSKPYRRYYSTQLDEEYAGNNNHWPSYTFATNGVATTDYSTTKAESDLDQIRIVPNPYYAYDSYENNALDNRVKITNLPRQATVTIYNINGTLVRQLTKDSPDTYIDWDIKNFAGIQVAGGIYIVHVNTNVGEKVLKWFGITRPPDLNTF
jgi:hypothetical protein